MNWKYFAIIPVAVLVASYFVQRNNEKHEYSNPNELTIYSRHYGYQLWEDIKKYPIRLSLDDIIAGMKANEEGRALLDEEETLTEFARKMAQAQKQSLQEQATTNLIRSEEFLEKLSQKNGIHEIEKNKLYYEIKSPGNLSEHLGSSSIGYFHYTITNLDGKEIVDTRKENQPKTIELDTAILGFSKGVHGMIKGERRVLYIHPDLAYGKFRHGIAPQMLIIIDVEAL